MLGLAKVALPGHADALYKMGKTDIYKSSFIILTLFHRKNLVSMSMLLKI